MIVSEFLRAELRAEPKARPAVEARFREALPFDCGRSSIPSTKHVGRPSIRKASRFKK